MSDAQGAVEAAAYQLLSAGVTLAPVFQDVPPGQQAPICIIAEISGDPVGGKTSRAEQGALTIYTEIWARARAPLLALQGEVKAALDGMTIRVGGFDVSFALDTAEGRQADDKTYVGTSSFTTFAIPA